MVYSQPQLGTFPPCSRATRGTRVIGHFANTWNRSSPTLIRRHGNPSAAADIYAVKAYGLVQNNLDHPTLADIQALCLLIIHEWGSRNAVRAYILLGQAARMLQMFRVLNSHHTEQDQFHRDESFRRTLWLIYILDCLLTSTPGRFPALSIGDTADVSLPCSDINFAFGNAVHVRTLSQQLNTAPHAHAASPSGDIGEFGYIVLASTIWRDVVHMLTTTPLQNFREEACVDLMAQIDGLRASLPMQFVDKPGQINLHMTMGSGYTFAMLHCLLHCSNIFLHRRRLLQEVTNPAINMDTFRGSGKAHEIVDRLLTSCHGIIALLSAVEAGSEKDHVPCFPIVMLFSSFTASATVAYLSLKGLTPHTATETAAHIVEDGLKFMSDGTEKWPLMSSWLRHLGVMQRVLANDANNANASRHNSAAPVGVKDEVSSNADTALGGAHGGGGSDVMEYDNHGLGHGHGHSHDGSVPPPQHGPLPAPRQISDIPRDGSDPPVAIPRRPGIATINGTSGGGASTPGTVSPPPVGPPPQYQQVYNPEIKQPSPELHHPNDGSSVPPQELQQQHPGQDMTGPELCGVFERQLLEMDDLAAFMGGGV